MTVISAMIRPLVVSAAVAVFVVALGWLSRLETERPGARLDSALGHGREIVERCSATIDPQMKRPVQVYLAIEDFFRPAHLRKLEFALARTGTAVGLNPVSTLGVGQIARQTYISALKNAGLDGGTAREWTDGLADDCLSVAVLQAYARQSNVSCDKDDVKCTIDLACFWHTGRHEGCNGGPQDRAYLANSVTAYLRSKRSDRTFTQ